jgi:hypothetical protein
VKQVENECEEIKMPDERESIMFIVRAWKEVDETTIVNCWHETDILFNNFKSTDSRVVRSVYDVKLQTDLDAVNKELNTLSLSKYQFVSSMAKSFVESCDEEVETSEELTDQQIIELVKPTDKPESDKELETLPCEQQISFKEASSCLKTLFDFYEENTFDTNVLSALDLLESAFEKLKLSNLKQKTMDDYIKKD